MSAVQRVRLIGLLAALTMLPACSHPRDVTLELPPQTRVDVSDRSPSEQIPAHQLAPDFRRLGEALATFWRAEQRFPRDLEELRAFTDEHQLDLRLTQLTNLSLRSKIYGLVLTGRCDFPHPDPADAATPIWSPATFELDATNPETIEISFEAGTPQGQAYLDEALRIFNERFATPR